MNKFGYLVLGLLASSAILPSAAAMEAKEFEAADGQRVFKYDAQSSHAEKQVYFRFKSLFDSVRASVGGKLYGLQEYLTYKPKDSAVLSMHAEFAEVKEKAMRDLDAVLDSAPSLDKRRVLGLFDALANREFRTYESLFGQADELIGYINSYALPEYVSGSCAYYNGSSITISPTDSARQFRYLTQASFIQSESQRLEAINPSFINTNQAYWSLLAYLTNTNAVQCSNGIFQPVKQEALDAFHAYGYRLDPRAAEYKFLENVLEERNYTYNRSLKFDVAEARRIAAEMAAGKSSLLTESQPPLVITKLDILAAARAKGGTDAPIVRYALAVDPVEHLAQAAEEKMVIGGKKAAAAAVEQKEEIAVVVAPQPVLIPAFTQEECEKLAQINTMLETIQIAQEAAYSRDERFAGFSKAEQIMAYGSEANDIIGAPTRQVVNELLRNQLEKRGIIVPGIPQVTQGAKQGYAAAGVYLNDWIQEKARTAELAVDVTAVVRGMSYTTQQAMRGSHHAKLFNTFWALRAMSGEYDKILAPSAQDQVRKGEIESLLTLSFTMIEDHNDRCAIGARGRDFLMQMGMLRFFKEQHSTIEVL